MEIGNKIKNLLIQFFGLINNSKKSKCIFYHDIHASITYTNMSTSIEMFEKHIQNIRRKGFEIVHSITKKNKQIEISFDDGFKGVYKNIELINRLKVPITVFVVSSYIDKQNYLSAIQLKEISKNPFIKIESHSHTHPNLALLSDEKLKIEFIQSKKILEKICEDKITSICYPEGFFNKKVIQCAKDAGYDKQYSSLPGLFIKDVFPNIKRRSLVQFSSVSQFNSILKGGDHFLSLWYSIKHLTR